MTRPSRENCASCVAGRQEVLRRLNLDTRKVDYVIALAGNPNTGKSTLFNALTGLRQHTGNWPGKTITRAEGAFSYKDKYYKLVDLPGTYSLHSFSPDEEVARDFIVDGQPDLTLVVCDATALTRNLNLVIQIRQITGRVIVALNLMDEARRNGYAIEVAALSEDLGVPVIPITARRGEGIDVLLESIHRFLSQSIPAPDPLPVKMSEPPLARALQHWKERVISVGVDEKQAGWVALRLMQGVSAPL
jgi:Fe2+ transport system protein B